MQLPRFPRPWLLLGLSVSLLPVLAGCDFTRLTANQTVDLFAQATPAIEQHWDYDMVGDAMPGNILQLEGIHRVVPRNKSLLMQLVQAYTSYAYGWIEDRAEVADAAGDMDKADALRQRARQMYTRARDLARYRLELEATGFDKAEHAGVPAFQKWLKDNFDSPDDAPMLLWAGYSWGSEINVARNDMAAVADLPFAIALVQRSVDLDPTYYHAAGLTFLAVSKTAAIGADLDAAKRLFERALSITHRKSLIIQLNYARYWAVKAQKKQLYLQLLHEVLSAPDNPATRLSDQIARRRARRYLTQTGDLFLE